MHAVYHHLYMRMTNDGSSQDGECASNNNVHASFLFLWDGFSKVCFIPPLLFWNLRFTGFVWVQGFSNWYGVGLGMLIWVWVCARGYGCVHVSVFMCGWGWGRHGGGEERAHVTWFKTFTTLWNILLSSSTEISFLNSVLLYYDFNSCHGISMV